MSHENMRAKQQADTLFEIAESLHKIVDLDPVKYKKLWQDSMEAQKQFWATNFDPVSLHNLLKEIRGRE